MIENFLLFGNKSNLPENRDENKLYFCSDTKELFKGQGLYTEAVRVVDTLPENMAQGVLYVLPSGEVKVFNGTDTIVLFNTNSTVEKEYVISSKGISEENTDDQIATAKAVYDFVINTVSTVEVDAYTKEEVDNLLSVVEQDCDWKESVDTFDSIATTYPEAEAGWTVSVKDTNTIYRYNGTEWIDIFTLINKSQLELENVDNTSDLNKPISTATQTALDNKMNKENPVGTGSFSMNRKSGTNIGQYSTAEGYNTTSSGDYSHAEGYYSTAGGSSSHAEGYGTTAGGVYSHAEGYNTSANGFASHTEGSGTSATDYAHAEGNNTHAKEDYSHVEGNGSITNAQYSHAEGYNSIAGSLYQHVQGKWNVEDKLNTYAHIVGGGTADNDRKNIHTLDWDGNAEFAGDVTATDEEGNKVSLVELANSGGELEDPVTVGTFSMNRKIDTVVGEYSTTLGSESTASGYASLAEGKSAAVSNYSHSEGEDSTSSGIASHAEGYNTIASGDYSHAQGTYTIAAGENQNVQGKYNIEDTEDTYAHIVGGGTSEDDRKNIYTLDWNGNAEFAGDVTATDEEGNKVSLLDKADKDHTHDFTKEQIGLGNVDNTSDLDKPVSTATQTALDNNLATAKEYTDTKVADLVGSAPETLDTLQEVAKAISDNEDVTTALNEAIGNKVDKSELDGFMLSENPTGTGSFSMNRLYGSTVGTNSVNLATPYNTNISGVSGDANAKTYTVSSWSSYLVVGNAIKYTYNNTTVYAKITSIDQANLSFKVDKTLSTEAISNVNMTIYTGGIASGNYSHAEGYGTIASRQYSHSEGSNTTASGESSHAEGYNTTASGNSSHAEGYSTIAYGDYSHAEGFGSCPSISNISGDANAKTYTVSSWNSNLAVDRIIKYNNIYAKITAIDKDNLSFTVDKTLSSTALSNVSMTIYTGGIANGKYSHSEGESTIASGNSSHAEGYGTVAKSGRAHAEGYYSTASGGQSHAEGSNTTASGDSSHAEGYNTKASGSYSHTEGYSTTASGVRSHAEGESTKAVGVDAHAEGYSTTANGDSSHAEGYSTTARGIYSHAEGYSTISGGTSSHAEGSGTIANGNSSHAEGQSTIAYGESSHAEGYTSSTYLNNVSGEANATTYTLSSWNSLVVVSHIIKYNDKYAKITTIDKDNLSFTVDKTLSTEAISNANMTIYYGGIANGKYSHIEGYYTIANGENQHVQGKYNVVDNENKYAHIIGGGTSNTSRKNIHTIDWNGNAEFAGTIKSKGSELMTTSNPKGTGSFSMNRLYNNSRGTNSINLSSPYELGSIYVTGDANVTTYTVSKWSSYLAVNRVVKYTLFNDTVYAKITAIDEANLTFTLDKTLSATSSSGKTIYIYNDIIASGDYSHSEGYGTIAGGDYSHAEGYGTMIANTVSGVSGSYNATTYTVSSWNSNLVVDRLVSYTSDNITICAKITSIDEANLTFKVDKTLSRSSSISNKTIYVYTGSGVAIGQYSHSEGYKTIASNQASHAEGESTKASGTSSHAEGSGTIASGSYSHAEGSNTIAYGSSSHSEGLGSRNSISGISGEANVTTYNISSWNSYLDIDKIIEYNNIYAKITAIDQANLTFTVDKTLSSTSISNVNMTIYTGGIASGTISHAEGSNTIAYGDYSHAEGTYSRASGYSSHAEGYNTTASGYSSHVEGQYTKSIGSSSHSEGMKTISYGEQSHAEGGYITSYTSLSNVSGDANAKTYTISSWNTNLSVNRIIEYNNIYAKITAIDQANLSFTVDKTLSSTALSNVSMTVYFGPIANGKSSHAEGRETQANGEQSHAEGYQTKANGNSSHAEGYITTASSYGSHAEGYQTTASNRGSHAEGERTTASGNYSHAEGLSTTASGDSSHAEGSGTYSVFNTTLTGEANATTYTLSSWNSTYIKVNNLIRYNNIYATITSIINSNNRTITLNKTLSTETLTNVSISVIYDGNIANGKSSHSEGYNTFAISDYQHVQGKYNVADTSNKYAHIVGGGTSNTERKNIHTIDWDGNAEFAGTIKSNGSELMVKNNPEGTGSLSMNRLYGSTIGTNSTNLATPYQIGVGYITGEANATTYTVSSWSSYLVVGNAIKYTYNNTTTYAKITAIDKYNLTFTVDKTLSTTALSNVNMTIYTGGIASGAYSCAEGYGTIASRDYSHAEGYKTTSSGSGSHAEGYSTTASGEASHTEGYSTTASGNYSHAEGLNTIAYGDYSHSEGLGYMNTILNISGGANDTTYTISSWSSYLTIGRIIKYNNVYAKITAIDQTNLTFTVDKTLSTTALSNVSMTIYTGGIASGSYSHAESRSTTASGQYSHAEGEYTTASGGGSHAEGYSTKANGGYSHTEGSGTTANGSKSHAEGYSTTASGEASHAEGYSTTANGDSSHAEGYQTKASGSSSHSEGSGTIASGNYSHAEGQKTIAHGVGSHVEGYSYYSSNISGISGEANATTYTISSWNKSYIIVGALVRYGTTYAVITAIDQANLSFTVDKTLSTEALSGASIIIYTGTANGDYSHVEGCCTISNTDYQHVQGKYNIPDTENKYAHIVGGGTGISSTERKNIHTIDWDGNAEFAGTIKSNGSELMVKNNPTGIGSFSMNRLYGSTVGTNSTNLATPHQLGSISNVSGDANTTTYTVSSWDSDLKVGTVIGYTYNNITTYAKITAIDQTNLTFTVDKTLSTIAISSVSIYTYEGAVASGQYSYTEGYRTIASGNYSHAEGYKTIAYGGYSHAEGGGSSDNTVISNVSGDANATTYTVSSWSSNLAVGRVIYYNNIYAKITAIDKDNLSFTVDKTLSTTALSNVSMTIYIRGIASGGYSHAEGYQTTASGDYSHAQGSKTTASGEYSHAEGSSTTASGQSSHAEGSSTISSGIGGSHAEGQYTIAYGTSSHAEGVGRNRTISNVSGDANDTAYTVSSWDSNLKVGTVIGYNNIYARISSINETNLIFTVDKTLSTIALSNVSMTMYIGGIAGGKYSHAEGYQTTASGEKSHAEGTSTTASGGGSHAEGYSTKASGNYSHAEGRNTEARGDCSHAEGFYTRAGSNYQHVQGKYSKDDNNNKYAHIVGGGTSDSDRKNIHTLDWNGNAEFAGDVTITDTNGNAISLLSVIADLQARIAVLEGQ